MVTDDFEEERKREEEKRRQLADDSAFKDTSQSGLITKPAEKTAEGEKSSSFWAYSGNGDEKIKINPDDPDRERVGIFVFRPVNGVEGSDREIITNFIQNNPEHFLKHNQGFTDILQLIEHFESGDYLTKGDSKGRKGINGFTPEMAAEVIIQAENKNGEKSRVSRSSEGNIERWPEIQEKLVKRETEFSDRKEGSYIDQVKKAVLHREVSSVAQTLSAGISKPSTHESGKRATPDMRLDKGLTKA